MKLKSPFGLVDRIIDQIVAGEAPDDYNFCGLIKKEIKPKLFIESVSRLHCEIDKSDIYYYKIINRSNSLISITEEELEEFNYKEDRSSGWMYLEMEEIQPNSEVVWVIACYPRGYK